MLARSKIADALVEKLKEIDGTSGQYNIDLHENVQKGLKFWDEVDDFPYCCLTTGEETRQYLPGNFKWAFLNVSIKIYVKADDPEEELEKALIDIENVIDANNDLEYDTNLQIEEIRIISISTDEGLLNPLGVGDILLEIRYEV